MPTRIPLSDPELIGYSKEHVIYELWMFRAVGQALVSPVQMSQPLRNALIESFAIHLRNLIDFFYPVQIQADDVVASEFSEDSSEWRSLSTISSTLSSACIRAHKEVSHLTRRRITGGPPEKAWDVAGLMGEIKNVLEKLISAASSKRLHQDLKNLADRW